MEAYEPRWVNSILNIIEVYSLRLGGLLIIYVQIKEKLFNFFQVRYSFRKPQSKRFKGLTNSHPQSDRLLSVDSQNIREQPRLDDICSTTRTTDQRRLNNDLSPNTIFKEIELRDQ